MIDRGVARRYAEAFVNALQNSKRLEAGLKELQDIAKSYEESSDLQKFLGSPEIAAEEKERLLNRIWSDDSEITSGAATSSGSHAVGPETMALLKLLLEWDRVDHLPAIAEEAVVVAEQRQGIVRGQVITARPISSAETELVAKAVGSLIGKKVVLERAVDPEILGGVRVTVGTTLLDSSVQTLLEDVRNQLKAVKVNS